MAGPMVGPLLEQLGLDLVTTYWAPDGEFPDHEPNPLLEENRRFIIDKVRAEGADLGIAWDGDADRCFFIDDTGAFVDGDFLTALLAESILEKQPGRGHPLRRARLARGAGHWSSGSAARAHVNRVGHAFFKTRMRDEGGEFGGEVSGHYYFARLLQRGLRHDPGAADPRAALQARTPSCPSCSSRCARSTSSPARSTPRSPTREAKMDEIEARYADGEITKLDGISVDYDDWHFNVRAVEHRAAAAPEPREPRLPARTWSAGATRCSQLIRS